jgi:hypothetical protein
LRINIGILSLTASTLMALLQYEFTCRVKSLKRDSSLWTLGNILSALDYCFCDSMQEIRLFPGKKLGETMRNCEFLCPCCCVLGEYIVCGVAGSLIQFSISVDGLCVVCLKCIGIQQINLSIHNCLW